MIDEKVIAQLIETQITDTVGSKVLEYFDNNEWIASIEKQIIIYARERFVEKFLDPAVINSVVDSIRGDVIKTVTSGNVPGLKELVNIDDIKKGVSVSVEETIANISEHLVEDSQWLSKIENMINQAVVTQTVARISSIDVNTVIKDQVNSKLDKLKADVVDETLTQGIQSTTSKIELTILEDHVVVENTLSAKNIEAVDTAVVKNLSVTGTINVDNPSWNELADEISRRSLESIDQEWQEQLVAQVAEKIKTQGIDFSAVNIDGQVLVKNGVLSNGITRSNLQKVGTLEDLTVTGDAHLSDTLNVINRRVGINTKTPEMALSIWDEEISVIAGRLKENVAYIGTGRNQSLSIGVNRTPAIDIDVNGLTTIKKLQLGVHSISHGTSLPGYAGTRGDMVFNVNINATDNVFAWVCLGGHKWKELKTA